MNPSMASTAINLFLILSIFPLLNFVGADNGYNPYPSSVQCPPPPPCICNPTPPLLPPPSIQPPPSPPPNAQPLPPPAATPQPPPTTQPLLPLPSQQTTPPPPPATACPPLPLTKPPPPPQITPPPPPATTLSPPPQITPPPPPATTFPPLPQTKPPPPPQITPPPPPATLSPPSQTTPPPPPPSRGICFKNSTESQICANILAITDGLLTTGRAEPCCSIVRNLSDIDNLACLCKSVEAKPFSMSPNINIFFRTCTGRRMPQGFTCPEPSPTIPPPPQTTPPPPPPFSGMCFKNSTESQICANILAITDGLLTTGKAEPCCSIVRNLSDIDNLACLCKSVGAKPFSMSPNINIFFRTCTGRRMPQGFTCPGPSPTIPPPPQTTPPPPPPSRGICFKNSTELQICANILAITDGLLTTGRAEPCCSIVRNLSDIDNLACLCKSVGQKPTTMSPNINIFFKTCTGRRYPQGCP